MAGGRRTCSEMKAILDLGVTSMHSLPVVTHTRGQRQQARRAPTPSVVVRGRNLPMRTTGHDLRHSWRHFLGLHLSVLTMAIRVSLSDMAPSVCWRVSWPPVGPPLDPSLGVPSLRFSALDVDWGGAWLYRRIREVAGPEALGRTSVFGCVLGRLGGLRQGKAPGLGGVFEGEQAHSNNLGAFKCSQYI